MRLVAFKRTVAVVVGVSAALCFGVAQDILYGPDKLVRANPDVLDLVVFMGEDAEALGLVQSRLEDRLRSRLQEAGITVTSDFIPDGAYLAVWVTALDRGAFVDVFFERLVEFDVDGSAARAWGSFWADGFLLTFASDGPATADRIANAAEDLVDDFLADYSEANPTVDRATAQEDLGGGDFDPTAVAPSPLMVPGAVEHELGTFASHAITIDGKEVHVYRLDGLEAGETISVEMTSDPVDTYLYRLNPQARTIVDADDDSPDTSRSELQFTVPETGEVWIGASSFWEDEAGPYGLSVTVNSGPGPGPPSGTLPDIFARAAPAPRPLLAPGTIDATLGDERWTVEGRQADVYTLAGVLPGEVVTVEMTSQDIDSSLYWLDPQAETIHARDYDSTSFGQAGLTLTVPEHGRVWIAASSHDGASVGPYTLSITVDAN